jgi:ABC-type long-subunit fatty acid transport system fused permease/ATPase subunit
LDNNDVKVLIQNEVCWYFYFYFYLYLSISLQTRVQVNAVDVFLLMAPSDVDLMFSLGGRLRVQRALKLVLASTSLLDG